MKCKVIGIGAAGNKATISLIENGIVESKNVLLINSTLKDVPENYRNIALQFSNSNGGCGKERAVAKKLCAQSISDNTLSRLDSIMDPDDQFCIIVNSSEGGTGCGSAPLIAKYMKEVIGVNVHMFVFTGFEEDGRGLQNTVEYFQELDEGYTVEAISNSKFLVGNNKLMAEKKANLEFVERVKILLGIGMIDSEQNIDETDLYKVTTTPGFMTIEHVELEERLKNIDSFNKIITSVIDDSKSLECSDLSAKRIAVFLNLSDRSKEFVDYSFKVIKERYGVPFEIFTHVQDEGDKEYINFIISGMNLPIEEVQRVYKKYQQMSESVNKSKDTFLEKTKELTGLKTDDMFNMIATKKEPEKKSNNESIQNNKKSFLKDFETQWDNQMNSGLTFVQVSNVSQEDEQKRKKEMFLKKEF